MAKVNIHLTFNGNCEEAFNFYKSAFGGEFSYLGRFKDAPQIEGMPTLSENERNLIMHVSLPISKETVIMGNDAIPSLGNVTFGNNFSISVSTDSKEEANRLFTRLSEGGKIIMPMGEAFWGAYFGMFTDKFGIYWMISYELPPNIG